MTANRLFGILIVVFAGLLLWYISTGLLTSAPLLLAFGSVGGLLAALLGLWLAFGKY